MERRTISYCLTVVLLQGYSLGKYLEVHVDKATKYLFVSSQSIVCRNPSAMFGRNTLTNPFRLPAQNVVTVHTISTEIKK